MIHDENLGPLRPASCCKVEAVVIMWAAVSQAVILIAGNFVPNGGQGPKRQIRKGTIARLSSPGGQGLQLLPFFVCEKRSGTCQGIPQATTTDVVSAALHQDRRKFIRHNAPQKRDILEKQLFLQTDGVSGNDGARDVPGGQFPSHGQDRGNQISKTFSPPRPGFHNQMSLLNNGLFYGLRHLELLRAVLVPGQADRNTSLRTENFRRSTGHKVCLKTVTTASRGWKKKGIRR